MSPVLTPDELARLYETDLHAAMVAVAREWLAEYHPGSGFAAILIDKGVGAPMGRFVIRRSDDGDGASPPPPGSPALALLPRSA
jgi:hypothetical protein